MIKKFKFINFKIMPPILAVLATIVIIIACGKGDLENFEHDGDMEQEIDDAVEKLFEGGILDSVAVAQMSSSEEESSSSELSSSSISSSSVLLSSSSEPSSSSLAPSSSSKYPYIVVCKVTVDTGTVKISIPPANRPKVECVEEANPTNVFKVLDPRDDVQWFDAPAWPNPAEGVYSNIQVKIYGDAPACQGLTATCSGTFRICATPTSCPELPSSSSAAPIPSSSSVAVAASSSSVGGSTVSSSSVSVTPSSSSKAKVTIICTLPETLTAGATVSLDTQRSYLKCSNTNASPTGNLIWAPAIFIGTNVAPDEGNYTDITVVANCGSGNIIDNCSKTTIVSGSNVASSSSAVTYTLACGSVPSTGIAGTTITPPAVTCNGTAVSSGLAWTPTTLNWSSPAAGTYTNISVSASSGNCAGKTATCSGTLTVTSPSTDQLNCTGMPGTVIAGTAITQPTVNCGTTPVTAGLTWTGAPTWTNPTADTYNVSVAATCGGSSKTASCGTLKVNPKLTCGSVPSTGIAGTTITPPTVTCGTAVSSGLAWTNAPNWDNPTANTYTNISVSASSGDCSGQTATCSGTITVSAPVVYELTCADLAPTGTAGKEITKPTVKCNGSDGTSTTVASPTWTPATLNWTSPTAGEYIVSASTSTGNCSGKSKDCGKITVEAAACDYLPDWCNNKKQSEVTNVPNSASLTGGSNGTCFFATEITTYCANSADAKINGVKGQGNVNCWNNSGTLPNKADGGYYIWIPANSTTGSNAWTGSATSGPTKTCPP